MVCVTVSCHTSGYQHCPAGVAEPYRSWLKEIVARTSIRGTQVSVEHRFSKYSKSHVKISRSNRFLSLEFNVTGFDRYEFKFRPKRSDFGRKKLRTAETAVGFRLSEVVLSPGRRGGKLGGLQQALRRTPVFYPYRADSQSRPFGRGAGRGAGSQ